MTPKLLVLAIKGRHRATERDYRNRAWLAWQVGLLTRVDPKKYPETPDALLGRKPAPEQRQAQTPLQIDAVMRQWRAVQG